MFLLLYQETVIRIFIEACNPISIRVVFLTGTRSFPELADLEDQPKMHNQICLQSFVKFRTIQGIYN